jgi:hypothetical protein
MSEYASLQALETITQNSGMDPGARSAIRALVQRFRETSDKAYGLSCGQLVNRMAWPDIGGQSEDGIRQDTASTLLQLLRYEAMSTRHSEIRDPSARTFEWVFESHSTTAENFDNLSLQGLRTLLDQR